MSYEDDGACPHCGGATELRAGKGWTCGGLELDRFRHCATCGARLIPRRADARVALDTGPATWTLAASGWSVNVGAVRVRLRGGTQDERTRYAAALVAFGGVGTPPAAGAIRVTFDGGTPEAQRALRAVLAEQGRLL